MHPDQTTPDTHRYRSADSNPDRRPKQEAHEEAIDESVDAASDEPGSAPDVEDGVRTAEAGHAYVGRTMDDDMQSSPRVTEPGAGTQEDDS